MPGAANNCRFVWLLGRLTGQSGGDVIASIEKALKVGVEAETQAESYGAF